MKRNTIQQKLVMDTVRELCGTHPTADSVYDRVRIRVPNVSRATVYRILNGMSQNGEIQRIRIPDTADRFDTRLGQHYHARCTDCGRVTDIDMPVLENLQIPESGEFEITGHDIVFFGLCKNCKSLRDTN